MAAHLYLSDSALYLEVHPDPSEDIPTMFLLTEAGQLGRSGMNSAGLGVCASSLMSTEDYVPIDPSLPPSAQKPLLPMSVVRRQFLHNKSFANALINIKMATRHVSNKLVVGTADNFVMGLEVTPSATHVMYPEGSDAFTVQANHFVSPAFLASPWEDRMPGGSTWYRAERVKRTYRANQGRMNEKLLREAYSDHLGFPSSVCQHMEDCTVRGVPDYPYKGANVTVAHVCYNLSQRRIVSCKGPPCEGEVRGWEIEKTDNVQGKLKPEEVKKRGW